MDFTAYITLCLILVAPSCHSTREGRAARTTWTPVTDRKDAAYLALVKTGEETCAGSIPSKSTVLTYCTHASTTSNAYAGLLDAADAKPTARGNVQVRAVNSVAQYPDTALKICAVSDWELNDHVATVPLNLKEDSGLPATNCTVLGFRDSGGKIVVHKSDQNIGGKDKCNVDGRKVDELLYAKASTVPEQLGTQDVGGPAVCGKEQWGISKKLEPANPSGNPATAPCNTYLSIPHYREWIEGVMTGKPVENEGSNNSTASSGYSIHSYLNKYSNWKVLGFLVPTIVTFLQY